MRPLVERTDAELLEAAAAGDGHAFAAFYDRHAGAVFGYCRRMLDDDHEAADAAQDAFVGLLARVHASPGSVANPSAYLFAAARNAALRAVSARRRTRPVEAVPETPPPAELPEGEAKVLTEDLQEAVRSANAALPVRQREVLALREIEELSYEEIGDRMSLSPNAAAQLAWRARGRFRSVVRRGALGGIMLRTPDCERAMTLTTLAEDGPLPREDEAWLTEHLDDCDRCRASRAVMAEAGATYRLWVPAAALVLAWREAVIAKAGEVVGADWSSLAAAGAGAGAGGAGGAGGAAAGAGAASGAGGTSGAGAGAAGVVRPRGATVAVLASVLAVLALVGGGALLLVDAGSEGDDPAARPAAPSLSPSSAPPASRRAAPRAGGDEGRARIAAAPPASLRRPGLTSDTDGQAGQRPGTAPLVRVSSPRPDAAPDRAPREPAPREPAPPTPPAPELASPAPPPAPVPADTPEPPVVTREPPPAPPPPPPPADDFIPPGLHPDGPPGHGGGVPPGLGGPAPPGHQHSRP
ncbi:MAG TPA: sigma-70 family RNA polymerase sigma factor [Solirubrobacteraceae bacterium]|jgi:RNA polymerase sigma factor (sigma-70 family)